MIWGVADVHEVVNRILTFLVNIVIINGTV